MRPSFAYNSEKKSYRGVYRVPSLNQSACVTFVVFSDCESCTRPNSTNPGSMEEAGEHGLTRGTCFVARRLEVVAVAGLLWISWCVLGAAGFHVFFFSFLFSWNAHGLLQVRLVYITKFFFVFTSGWCVPYGSSAINYHYYQEHTSSEQRKRLEAERKK